MSVIGIPMISKCCWKIHENEISELVKEVAKESCEEALKAEVEATKMKM